MDISTFWPTIRPFVSTQVQHGMQLAAGMLAMHGAIKGSQEGQFIEIGTSIVMWAIVAAYGWWNDQGKRQLVALMAKSKPVVPPTATTAEAVKAATEAAKV